MAQQRRKAPVRRTQKKRATKKANHTLNWAGALFVVFGAVAAVPLGLLGAVFANALRLAVGNTFQFAAGLLALFGVWLLGTGNLPRVKPRVLWGAGLVYLSVLTLLTSQTLTQQAIHDQFIPRLWRLLQNDFALMTTTSDVGGGMIGGVLYALFEVLLSHVGVLVLFWLLALVGVLIVANVQPAQVFALFNRIGHWSHQLGRAGLQATKQVVKTKAHTPPKTAKPLQSPKQAKTPQPVVEDPADEFTINAPVQPSTPKAAPAPAPAPEPEVALPLKAATASAADYELPTLDLLTPVPVVDQSTEVNAIKANRVRLKETLASFGVDVTVKAATLGPTITQYEIQPATGVKVAKIVNLADDLALALAAKDIRIEAPIPGKSLIGIEVPNANVATVGYRDVLEQTAAQLDKPLIVPLGKDVDGRIQTMDLTKMPHLLVAGATGSGKSVMINVIITTILMTTKPTDVRLMLIDPKRVELSVYNGVPHLLTPVVTEAKKAPSALNKVLAEMERRYERFAAAGVRNMAEYNRKAALQEDEPRMPYIVVIVDELSDLMMVAGNEVETAIVRLAQMARAAGIHLIIATQRPSVDVITGLIKANIPSRIAFAVSSGVDSRTILDSNGAEKLLGRGDMLYQPIDAAKPVRIQSAFIASEDVEAVVGRITAQVAPAYEATMAPSDTADEDAAGGDSDDALYEEAKAFVILQKSASTSMLQRHFRIGYNRAARLIDDLEAAQVIGPSLGSKPRQVLLAPEPE